MAPAAAVAATKLGQKNPKTLEKPSIFYDTQKMYLGGIPVGASVTQRQKAI